MTRFLYGWPISVRAQRDKNGARTLGGSSGRNRKNCWRFPEIVYLCEGGNQVFDNRWGYSGKEEQETVSGLPYLDYGARFYDPSVCRWLSPDPLAEEYYGLSPYGFCAGNPVGLIDSGGYDLVLAGKNGSSVTFKTDLVNRNIDFGKLGVDWNGKYEFEGTEVLSSALDIVGIADPTGIADGANAVLQASEGNWMGAAISAAGIVPILGDVAKSGKITKGARILKAVVDPAAINKHHINPKAVYRDNGALKDVLKLNGKKNLMEVPAGFHGNHPAYSRWITKKINKLITKDNLSERTMEELMEEARKEISKAQEQYNSGVVKNMNDYLKKLEEMVQ